MKSFLCIIVLLVLVSHVSAGPSFVRDFTKFMKTYGKVYPTQDELNVRYNIFLSNLQFVQSHNKRASKGLETYTVEINKFADWSRDEWTSFLSASPKNRPDFLPAAVPSLHKASTVKVLPNAIDWRTQGLVSEVKDQGQCGSCWTFSATGSIESSWALEHGSKSMVSVSEQEFVDCINDGMGCGGGWPTWTYDYLISQGDGADSEAAYPYLGTDGHQCAHNSDTAVAWITSYVNITSGDEMGLTTASSITPGVSVCIDASQSGFKLYKTGVYRDQQCKKGVDDLDHAVLVVGYGTYVNGTSTDYYLVKNSWGGDWGDKGYIKMFRDTRGNTNNCGIATVATYPIARTYS